MSGSYRQCVECGKRALKFATRCPGCGIELPNPEPFEESGTPELRWSHSFKAAMAVLAVGLAIASYERSPASPDTLSAETPYMAAEASLGATPRADTSTVATRKTVPVATSKAVPVATPKAAPVAAAKTVAAPAIVAAPAAVPVVTPAIVAAPKIVVPRATIVAPKFVIAPAPIVTPAAVVAPTTVAVSAKVKPGVMLVAKGWTHVRKRRNVNATLEAVLTPGDTVTADSLANGWYRVALYGEVLGWAKETTLARP